MVALIVALALALISPAASMPTYDLTGTVTHPTDLSLPVAVGSPCAGMEGGNVFVYDVAKTTILAWGDIGPGVIANVEDKHAAKGQHCRHPFRVEDVPRADAYTLYVPEHSEIPMTRAELDAAHWEIAL